MESDDKLKEIDIKNWTCYFFDAITKFGDFYPNNVLIDEKSYENILVYNISYITLNGAKPLRISFNKLEGFLKIYDGTRNSVLFGTEIYDFIYSRIRYLLEVKSSIKYVISHNYAKIKDDLYNLCS